MARPGKRPASRYKGPDPSPSPAPEVTGTRYERKDLIGPFTPRKGGKIDRSRTTDKFRNA